MTIEDNGTSIPIFEQDKSAPVEPSHMEVALIIDNVVSQVVNYSPLTGESLSDMLLRFEYEEYVVHAGAYKGMIKHGESLIEPSPYPSWVFSDDFKIWMPPIPIPDTEYIYLWDEPTLSWVKDPAYNL